MPIPEPQPRDDQSPREVEVVLPVDADQSTLERLGLPMIIDIRDHERCRAFLQVPAGLPIAFIAAQLPEGTEFNEVDSSSAPVASTVNSRV